MKKFLCLLLTFLMTVCGAAAAESTIDLSTMTLDELVALRNSVSAEIDERTAHEPYILPAGVYVAGESIKAGNYTIAAPKDKDDYLSLGVFESMELMKQFRAEDKVSLCIMYAIVDPGESAFVSLADGMVLVTWDPAEIEATTADWLP